MVMLSNWVAIVYIMDKIQLVTKTPNYFTFAHFMSIVMKFIIIFLVGYFTDNMKTAFIIWITFEVIRWCDVTAYYKITKKE